jgi:hypothetical protein
MVYRFDIADIVVKAFIGCKYINYYIRETTMKEFLFSKVFNPMVEKDVIIKMLISFIMFSTTIVLFYVLLIIAEDITVLGQVHSMLILMLIGYFFIFRGVGKARYFIVMISPVGVFTLFAIIMGPNNADIDTPTILSNSVTEMSSSLKIIIIVFVISIYIVNGILLMYNKDINQYMKQAFDERKGYITK